MTLRDQETGGGGGGGSTTAPPPRPPPLKRKRRRQAVILTTLLLLLTILLVGVILGVTVFRVKNPKTQLVSASLYGISPRVSFPAIKIELNVTLNLTLLVKNNNHASFKGDPGESMLLYQGNQVGSAELEPGLIPARATSTLVCLLTLEVDRFADTGLTSLIRDIMAGELVMETKTRIPGRVKLLGIFKRHIISNSDCQIVIGFPELKIKSQECKDHIKL